MFGKPHPVRSGLINERTGMKKPRSWLDKLFTNGTGKIASSYDYETR